MENSSNSHLIAFLSQTAYANDSIRENPRESCKKSSSKQSHSFTPAQKFSPEHCETFIEQEELQKSLPPLSSNRVVEAKSDSSDGGEVIDASRETNDGWTVVKPRGRNSRSSIKTKFQSVSQENKVQEWRKLESQSKFGQDWSSLPRTTEISRGSTHAFKRNLDPYQTRKSSGRTNDTPKSQREGMEQISPLQNLHFETNKVTGGQRFVNDTSVRIGSQSTKALPNGVFPLCAHFLQDNRKGACYKHPSPCPKCSKDSYKLLFGVWRRTEKEWQIMRSYPKGVNLKTPFRPCWHFSNGRKCPKNPCTFAHGREELDFWTFARESGMSMSGI